MFRAAALIFTVVLLVHLGGAAEPSLTHLFPASGQQGTTVSVTASGKFEPWPPQVWTDAPGLTFQPAEKAPKFEVAIAPDAAAGPRLVRFFNSEGVSAPRFFIVSREAELLETEPNDEFREPQKIAGLPVIIGGRLEKSGDVDSFGVELKRGQTLVARAEAFVLMSTFDGMLRIVDPAGNQLAFNHDGRTFDPLLAFEAPADGTFIVQIMGFAYPANSEVRFAGGEGCIYRLHLTTGPVIRHTWPLAVQRGAKQSVKLAGWNLGAQTAEIDGTRAGAEPHCVEKSDADFTAEPLLPLSGFSETVEADAAAEPQLLAVPSAVTGRIAKAGEEDRFSFAAIKSRVYELALTASRIGSALDGWVKIEDGDGKELARNDDAGGSRDPQLTWTAPADGTFTAIVGELTHRGGEDYIYRLTIAEATPAAEATTAAHALKLDAGKSGELKVNVKLAHGFKSKLQLHAKGLPAGITAPDVEVPEKGGDVTVKFDAAGEAAAGGQPFQLVLREVESGKEKPVRYFLTSAGEDNGVPQGYSTLVIDSTDQLWLTVVAATPPPADPAATAAEVK